MRRNRLPPGGGNGHVESAAQSESSGSPAAAAEPAAPSTDNGCAVQSVQAGELA